MNQTNYRRPCYAHSFVFCAMISIYGCQWHAHIESKPAEKPSPTAAVLQAGEFKSDISCDGVKYDEDDMNRAVMLIVSKKLDILGEETLPMLQNKMHTAKAMREWAAHLSDAPLSGRYLSWIDYYERQVSDDLKRVESRSPSRDEEFKHDIMRKMDRAAKLERCLPKPE